MKNIFSKFIVWDCSSNTIYLSDKKPSISPAREELWEDVDIIYNDNGSITIEGTAYDYGICFHSVYPSELDYKVHPKYISKTRFTKKDIIHPGWHLKEKTIHKKIITDKYTIIQHL